MRREERQDNLTGANRWQNTLHWNIGKIMRFLHKIFPTCLLIYIAMSSLSAAVEQPEIPKTELVAPLEGKLKFPFTKEESKRCGKWGNNSQDYPYFGAPRAHNKRNHAGVDIYPQGGAGASVKALADGVIIKIAPFYIRANGEVTYGILVDHADFVVNYSELEKPDMEVSTTIRKGQIIGRISGTEQLHFELYAKGTRDWLRWYATKPADLLDPTEMMMNVLNINAGPAQESAGQPQPSLLKVISLPATPESPSSALPRHHSDVP